MFDTLHPDDGDKMGHGDEFVPSGMAFVEGRYSVAPWFGRHVGGGEERGKDRICVQAEVRPLPDLRGLLRPLRSTFPGITPIRFCHVV